MFELSRQFRFEAAHTIDGGVNAETNRRIHGHSYRAEATVRGAPDPQTGMVIDLGLFERVLEDARQGLDHRFLDEIEDLGPPTLENLCVWIWRRLAPRIGNLYKVTVYRDCYSETCVYRGPGKAAA